MRGRDVDEERPDERTPGRADVHWFMVAAVVWELLAIAALAKAVGLF